MVLSELELKAYICLGQAEVAPQLELSIYTVTCLNILNRGWYEWSIREAGVSPSQRSRLCMK